MSSTSTAKDRPANGADRPADPTYEELEQFLKAHAEGRSPPPRGAQGAAFSDPLMAELARIVSQDSRPAAVERPAMPSVHDPFDPVSQLPGSTALSNADDPLKAFEEELRRFDAAHRANLEPAHPVIKPAAPQVEVPVDYRRYAPVPEPVAFEDTMPPPPVMPELPQPYGTQQVVAAPQPMGEAPHEAAGPQELEPQGVAAPDLAAVAPPPRSRRTLVLLASAAAIAVAGVIGSAAFFKKPKSGGEAPVIAAKTTPVKEKPADPGGVEVPGQDRQVLARKTDEPKPPAQVVTKEEQPVDLNQVPKREAPRVTAPAEGQGVPPAPIMMPQGSAQPPAQPQPPATAGGFEAKRVRSIKIGPEGEAPTAAAAPTTPPAAPPAPAAPTPATPSVTAALPTSVPAVVPAPPAAPAATPAASPRVILPNPVAPKADAPKSEARPATVTRPVQQAATTTPQPARPRPTTAPAAASSDENAPMSLRPPAGSASAALRRPTTPAPAAASAGESEEGGAGRYAVQLAAPGNEAEARAAASRLKERHSSVLGGYSPTVRRADIGDRTVYRVRVTGLSREGAQGLCSKLKANGGSCFVAGN